MSAGDLRDAYMQYVRGRGKGAWTGGLGNDVFKISLAIISAITTGEGGWAFVNE